MQQIVYCLQAVLCRQRNYHKGLFLILILTFVFCMRFGFEIINDLTESVENHTWFANTKYLFHAICTVTVYIQAL